MGQVRVTLVAALVLIVVLRGAGKARIALLGGVVQAVGAGDVGQLGGELLKRLGPDPGTTSKRR